MVKNCAHHKQKTLAVAVPLASVSVRVLVRHLEDGSQPMEEGCAHLLVEVVHTQLADC